MSFPFDRLVSPGMVDSTARSYPWNAISSNKDTSYNHLTEVCWYPTEHFWFLGFLLPPCPTSPFFFSPLDSLWPLSPASDHIFWNAVPTWLPTPKGRWKTGWWNHPEVGSIEYEFWTAQMPGYPKPINEDSYYHMRLHSYNGRYVCSIISRESSHDKILRASYR